jgi:hypothetical protein
MQRPPDREMRQRPQQPDCDDCADRNVCGAPQDNADDHGNDGGLAISLSFDHTATFWLSE